MKTKTKKATGANGKINGQFKSYRFTGQDPLATQVVEVITASGKKMADITRGSGVATGTMTNWKKKKTKRPQACTLNAVLRSFGMRLGIEAIPRREIDRRK